MSNYIPGFGPSSSRLCIVTDYPERENHSSMTLLQECLPVDVNSCYLTSLSKYKFVKNTQISDDNREQLWKELDLLDPNCILILGNETLWELTRNKGLHLYRGSILKTINQRYKCVVSFNPGSILFTKKSEEKEDKGLKNWKDLVTVKWDIRRAVEESKTKEFTENHYDLSIARTNLDLYRFINSTNNRQLVSVDIETFHTVPICISLAFSSKRSISVPLIKFPDFETTKSDLVHNWKDVAEVLADPSIMKIGQNFKFDETLLKYCYDDKLYFGLKTQSFYFDTMLAFKTLYPELSPSLAFQCSIYTREPYYKEEGKGYNPRKDKADRLLLYNAKDAVITFECFEKEYKELEEQNKLQFFFERVMPLHPFYSSMESRGIKVDLLQRRILKETSLENIKNYEEELFKFIGRELNVNSPKQVNDLLYIELKLPIRDGTDEKTLEALLRNNLSSQKYEKEQRIIELILLIRKEKKLIGTYLEAQTSLRGYHSDVPIELQIPNENVEVLRTNYRIMLETGRTSTSVLKPPITTDTMGVAIQTVTKDYGDENKVGGNLRSIFIPDDGYIFIEPDLSQAEARVVALLANDDRLTRIFKYGVDIHRTTALWINEIKVLDKKFEEFYALPDNPFNEIEIINLVKEINKSLKELINENDRQVLGKKIRHAGNYDVGKHEAALQAKISELVAGRALEKFHKTNPNIRGVFHFETIEAIKNNDRELINPFGRRRTFLNRFGKEMFKEAYAFLPQSTVSDQLKFAMLRICKRLPNLIVLCEMHDSFLAQIKINELKDNVFRIIKEELETEIDFRNCSLPRGVLKIPCDIGISEQNWNNMKKVKI